MTKHPDDFDEPWQLDPTTGEPYDSTGGEWSVATTRIVYAGVLAVVLIVVAVMVYVGLHPR